MANSIFTPFVIPAGVSLPVAEVIDALTGVLYSLYGNCGVRFIPAVIFVTTIHVVGCSLVLGDF